MSIILFLLSCGTEVGLIGYTEKGQGDTAIVDTQLEEPSAEPSEPASEPSDSPTPDPANEGITGYVDWKLQQVSCPACVGQANEITISFNAEFHTPITDSHTEWIPEVGECTQQLLITNPSTNKVDVGSSLTLQGNVHTINVPKVGVGKYETNQIFETQYERDTTYTISLDQLTFNLQSIRGFDYLEPWEMLYVDPSYAYAAPILRSGMTFFWGPSGSESKFMITVAAYSSDGSQFLGYVTCVGPDQGFMTIPSTYLSAFPSYSLAAIHMARHSVELIETDFNNSFIESHMEWEVIGTGYIQ